MNDSWVLKLTHTEENLFMESFLKMSEDLRKQWTNKQEKHMSGVDISTELDDLMKVYVDAHDHLKEKEAASLTTLIYYMKDFIKVTEKKKEVFDKMETLKRKMGVEDKKEDEEDGDDE